jgi:hypothetical protein
VQTNWQKKSGETIKWHLGVLDWNVSTGGLTACWLDGDGDGDGSSGSKHVAIKLLQIELFVGL